MPDYVALDSGNAKDSLSVAEARHVARARILDILDALLDMGMNVENKVADRRSCLKDVLDFAEGAEGTEEKFVTKLRPELARRLARLGKEQDDAKQGIAKREATAPEDSGPSKILPNGP